jgi:chemotaxis signal transduction protein
MTAMVCFRAGENRYAIPVTSTLAVRPALGVVPLPSPQPNVIGVLPGDPILSVITPLSATGKHVLVITTPDHDYGLLVDEVTGVHNIDDEHVGPAPLGQDHRLIAGVTKRAGALLFLADPTAMGALL